MSSSLSESLQRILDRFDNAWNDPTPPSIEDYLRACEPANGASADRVDLHRPGTPSDGRGAGRVEEMYLRRFPVLNEDTRGRRRPGGREFELRRRREPNLSPTEYLERWPGYRDELAHLLDAHLTFPTTTDDTRNGKAGADRQKASEEARDGLAFLLPPQAADELGRLGGYRILKVLGSGGMGVVLLAEDAQLQRPVALKVMRPGLAANDAARQRFLREARAVAALEHDHIVTIYQVGEDHGVPFLAMECLEGETLQARLKRDTTLPLVEVLRLGRAIADGLSAAHGLGLVHCDIKPGNIWLEHANRSLTVAAQILSEPPPSGSGAVAGHGDRSAESLCIGAKAGTAQRRAQLDHRDTQSAGFSLSSVVLRPDGRQIAVGSDDGFIRLYDPKTGRLQRAAFRPAQVYSLLSTLPGLVSRWPPVGIVL